MGDAWNLPHRGGDYRSPRGAFFSALFVSAFPPLERSCPTPAVVWQALTSTADETRASNVKATEKWLRMGMFPMMVRP
jgi:hypothetical protein